MGSWKKWLIVVSGIAAIIGYWVGILAIIGGAVSAIAGLLLNDSDDTE